MLECGCRSRRANRTRSEAGDRDRLHHNRLDGVVILGSDLRDLLADVKSLGNLPKHRMLRVAPGEPVKEVVVRNVDEELGASAVGLSSVGHGQGAGFVAVPGDVLILDVASTAPLLGGARLEVLERAVRRIAGSCPWVLRVLRVRATELIHEPRDHAMKVNSIVEAGLAQINEVRRGDGHTVEEDLRFERPLRRVKGCSGIRHVRVVSAYTLTKKNPRSADL